MIPFRQPSTIRRSRITIRFDSITGILQQLASCWCQRRSSRLAPFGSARVRKLPSCRLCRADFVQSTSGSGKVESGGSRLILGACAGSNPSSPRAAMRFGGRRANADRCDGGDTTIIRRLASGGEFRRRKANRGTARSVLRDSSQSARELARPNHHSSDSRTSKSASNSSAFKRKQIANLNINDSWRTPRAIRVH